MYGGGEGGRVEELGGGIGRLGAWGGARGGAGRGTWRRGVHGGTGGGAGRQRARGAARGGGAGRLGAGGGTGRHMEARGGEAQGGWGPGAGCGEARGGAGGGAWWRRREVEGLGGRGEARRAGAWRGASGGAGGRLREVGGPEGRGEARGGAGGGAWRGAPGGTVGEAQGSWGPGAGRGEARGGWGEAQGGWGPGGAWGGVGRRGEVQGGAGRCREGGGRGEAGGSPCPASHTQGHWPGPTTHSHPVNPTLPAGWEGRREDNTREGTSPIRKIGLLEGAEPRLPSTGTHSLPRRPAGEEPRHQPGCGSPATPTGSLVAAPGQTLDCWTLVSTSSGALLNQVRMQLRRRPRSEQQDWCPRQEATPSGLSLPPALPSSWHTSLLWDPLVRGKGDTKPTSLSTGVAEPRAPTAAGSPGHSRKHACSWGKESKRQRMCARNTPQGHTQAHSQAASPPRGPVSLLTAHTHPCEAHCGRGTSSPEGTEASPSLQAHPVRALSLPPPTGQSPCGHGRARAATRRD